MILMLLQNNTLDELIREEVISKRSKYNYINLLNKIGISKNYVPKDQIEITTSENFEYYQYIHKSEFADKLFRRVEYK